MQQSDNLTAEELEAFQKLPQSEKRDVVLTVSKRQAERAISDEIIDYFKQLNASDLSPISTSA